MYAKDFKFAIGEKNRFRNNQDCYICGIFCIKFSLWYDRIDIFRHFGPLNAIYEKLSFILELCDPENPYFDV